jgi:uncharacterized membrane-anchored protein
MKYLRLVLLLHLLFFGAWGVKLLHSHGDGESVWLATSPVDPRDPLAGHFVSLRFDQLQMREAFACGHRGSVGRGVYIRLAPAGETVHTEKGPRTLWVPVECKCDRVEDSDTRTWLRGTWLSSRNMLVSEDRLEFGIERFYMAEGSPLRNARTGSVVAAVRINRHRKGRITDLLFLRTTPPKPRGS